MSNHVLDVATWSSKIFQKNSQSSSRSVLSSCPHLSNWLQSPLSAVFLLYPKQVLLTELLVSPRSFHCSSSQLQPNQCCGHPPIIALLPTHSPFTTQRQNEFLKVSIRSSRSPIYSTTKASCWTFNKTQIPLTLSVKPYMIGLSWPLRSTFSFPTRFGASGRKKAKVILAFGPNYIGVVPPCHSDLSVTITSSARPSLASQSK